jgi:ABC-2 type transport system permease protein
MDVSPYQHVPQMPVAGFSPGSALALLAVAVVLAAVGVSGFRRRDAGY